MQGQKKLSFSALALSVWTAALAESLEPGVSLRGMLLYGVLGALLLTGISAVLCVCWQQTHGGLLNVPDGSANSLRRHCPDQVKGTPRYADLSLTAPLFLCPPTVYAPGDKKSSPQT